MKSNIYFTRVPGSQLISHLAARRLVKYAAWSSRACYLGDLDVFSKQRRWVQRYWYRINIILILRRLRMRQMLLTQSRKHHTIASYAKKKKESEFQHTMEKNSSTHHYNQWPWSSRCHSQCGSATARTPYRTYAGCSSDHFA